jgi:hypothetical protein
LWNPHEATRVIHGKTIPTRHFNKLLTSVNIFLLVEVFFKRTISRIENRPRSTAPVPEPINFALPIFGGLVLTAGLARCFVSRPASRPA